jgi:hypothetical protein
MSTYTSEPGTRLAGRYRLEDRVGAAGGWAVWKAIDETLARAVTVLTFAPGFPRVREVVTAARAASRLTDSRLAQVFDVEDTGDRAYVVMEWVVGDSIDDLLAAGPLDPARGVDLVLEAAQALAGAHAAGLAHLRLTPESLRWTPGGGVKITGLGINAALAGATADDPALADTRGLARLLYATLTGYWPGADYNRLPPAPMADSLPCSPRQVCAGVPAPIDAVTCQALFQRPSRNGPPLTSPAMLADALARVAPPAIPPLPAAPPTAADPVTARAEGGLDTAQWTHMPPAARRGDRGPRGAPPRRGPAPQRSLAARLMISLVTLLVITVAAVIVWTMSHSGRTPAQATGPIPSAQPSNTVPAAVQPVSAHGFDVTGDRINENDDKASLAIDGNPNTFWYTQQYYGYPVFGNLKKGSGLILDMGKPVRLSQLDVLFGKNYGADVEIKVGNDNTLSQATVDSMSTVARASNVGGDHTFAATGAPAARYILIWFTRLPPMIGASGSYQAEIYNIVVRGSS